MTTYQLLDAISDSINPLLGVITLAIPWFKRTQRGRRALLVNALTLSAVGMAYLVVAFDRMGELWSKMGLDFSTHAAVYLSIAASLSLQGVVYRRLAGALGIAYAVLMHVQRYHSWPDLVTTALCMGTVLMLGAGALRRFANLETLSQLTDPGSASRGNIVG